MLKLLAFLLTRSPNYLNILKRLELGVFFFCWRQSILAEEECRFNLAKILQKQCKDEYSHAMFFAECEGKPLNHTATQWLNKPRWKEAHTWSYLGDTIFADGISQKFRCARVFFNGEFAKSYYWDDKLAFMAILEELQYKFYKELIIFLPTNLQSQFKAIILSEKEHSRLLFEQVKKEELIIYWQLRLILSLPFAIYDLWMLRKG
jgi:hypothetical protein